MAEVTFAVAIADLAQVRSQGSQATEVEFRRVMDDQHHAVLLQEQLPGAAEVGFQDTLVSDGGAFHEIITTAQGVGVLALFGQRTPGVAGEAVGQIDQRTGAALVAQPSGTEVFLAKGLQSEGRRHHGFSLTPDQSSFSLLYKQPCRSGQT